MIQAFTETAISAFISTEDNRIDKTVASTQIRFLVKFINDLDGSVDYSYPSATIYNRYTKMDFSYNSPNPGLYEGQVKLLPAGHWKYEVYEVSWIGSVVVASGTAPANETDVLSVADTNGVVQGIVTKGILNLTEKAGTEQVQYTEYEAPSSTNYIYTGVSSPDIFNEYSLNFDGVDDILITTKDSSIMPTDNLTVGCWINPTTWAFTGNDQVRYPFGCVSAGGWGVYFSNNYNGTITTFKSFIRVSDTGSGSPGYLQPSAGTGFSSALRALTGWHYVALTYTKATGVASVYLDGVEKGTASGLAGADLVYHVVLNRPLMFGADATTDTTGQDFFDGNIDECSVWNKALTSAELIAVYNSGVPIDLLSDAGDYVSSSNLQGYWRNGDTAGTSVYPTIEDYSSNSNDGTMTNMDSGDIVTDTP